LHPGAAGLGALCAVHHLLREVREQTDPCTGGTVTAMALPIGATSTPPLRSRTGPLVVVTVGLVATLGAAAVAPTWFSYRDEFELTVMSSGGARLLVTVGAAVLALVAIRSGSLPLLVLALSVQLILPLVFVAEVALAEQLSDTSIVKTTGRDLWFLAWAITTAGLIWAVATPTPPSRTIAPEARPG
jgi:hypothetical protein